MMMIQNKVKDKHIRKKLYLYIRQSDDRQVEDHTGSTAVQKAMFDRAIQYGFPAENVKTVVSDQGRSATTVSGRVGFEEMVNDIRSGSVGAVLCYHTSRLARNAADMQKLINICSATDTLIIDDQGVYDMSNENDFILVAFKSIIDAAEIRRMTALAKASKLAKARKGELWIPVPIGFIWVGSGKDSRIEFTRNKAVQKAVQDLFKQFKRLKTGHAVLKYFNGRGVLFPTCIYEGKGEPHYEWKRLTSSHILSILHNPVYAGSYVHGKYRYEPKILPDGSKSRSTNGTLLPVDDWAVHIPNHHKGYISFEEFQNNTERLKNNTTSLRAGCLGAARNGAALLQGVLKCGKCSRSILVRYKDRESYTYTCYQMSRKYGEPFCLCVHGKYVDEAVTKKLLEVFTPSQIELSIAAAKTIKRRALEKTKEWDDSIRQAQLKLEDAEKRFKLVNPRHRNVAEKLEAEWEQRIKEVKELERKREEARKSKPLILDPSKIDAIKILAKNMPDLWRSPQMSNVIRKQLLRIVIERVVILKIKQTAHISIKWKTGTWTETTATIPKPGQYSRENTVVNNIIRELTPTHTDRQIVDYLNQAGHRTFIKRKFTNQSVCVLRRTFALTNIINTEGRVKIVEASKHLGIHPMTVNQMCIDGKLDCIRSRIGAPWWIKLPPLSKSKINSKPVNPLLEVNFM